MTNNKKLEILLSCMHQKDNELIRISNIKSNVLMINQCDSNNIFEEELANQKLARRHDTKERGLSKSRNYGLEHSKGDICLIADNDEYFYDDCEEKILAAYEKLKDADVIVFRLSNRKKKVKETLHRIGFFELLRVSSWQISFKRRSILNAKLRFNERMGAGTGNGGEEEVNFLIECHRAGLKIYYVPEDIAYMREDAEESTWLSSFDEKFFYNRGMTTAYILGRPLAILYGVYYVIRKKSMYSKDISSVAAFKAVMKGIIQNKLKK